MKSILRKIWAAYGIVLFFVLWIILFPFYLIAFFVFPKMGKRFIIWFSHHIYTRLFFSLTLIKIKVSGREWLKKRQQYIIVSNHSSTIDFMANAYAFPGVYQFLAKKELLKIPIFGLIVRRLCVIVDRSNNTSRRKSIEYLKKMLAEGYSIFIYPEGTRNLTDDPLLPFQNGAFKIAIETGTPIAVQTILNAPSICKNDLSPGILRIAWSKPIETKGMEQKDMRELRETVRNQMLGHLNH